MKEITIFFKNSKYLKRFIDVTKGPPYDFDNLLENDFNGTFISDFFLIPPKGHEYYSSYYDFVAHSQFVILSLSSEINVFSNDIKDIPIGSAFQKYTEELKREEIDKKTELFEIFWDKKINDIKIIDLFLILEIVHELKDKLFDFSAIYIGLLYRHKNKYSDEFELVIDYIEEEIRRNKKIYNY